MPTVSEMADRCCYDAWDDHRGTPVMIHVVSDRYWLLIVLLAAAGAGAENLLAEC